MDAADFYAGQARYLGAAALPVRDERQQVVLVKPHYKSVWHCPAA
jgi:hypothetical protein